MSKIIDHVSAIQKYIGVINRANDMHALIIEGLPGWGKTTAVEKALYGAGIEGIHLGAYSTPLNLYHFLAENNESVVLIDDCSGLFNEKSAMAILKSATWAALDRERKVKWGSSSLLVNTPGFVFSGKLIIICNYFPKTPDGEAIRSRSYVRKVDVSVEEAKFLTNVSAKIVFMMKVMLVLYSRSSKNRLPHLKIEGKMKDMLVNIEFFIPHKFHVLPLALRKSPYP